MSKKPRSIRTEVFCKKDVLQNLEENTCFGACLQLYHYLFIYLSIYLFIYLFIY